MLALLGLIPQILGLGGSIVDLLKQKSKAESDKELKEIDKQIEAVREKRAVLIAEAGSAFGGTINSAMRATIALSASLLMFKLWAWDKVGGSIAGCSGKFGSLPGCEYFLTDPLNEWELGALTTIICFYFVSEKFGKK